MHSYADLVKDDVHVHVVAICNTVQYVIHCCPLVI